MRSGRSSYFRFPACAATIVVVCAATCTAAEPEGLTQLHNKIQPILAQYCSDCHLDGSHKGGVAFDSFKSDQELMQSRELWWKVLKNVRAGLMPPHKKPQPTDAEKHQLADWIKYRAFAIDPSNPDPGRVTIHRLNRAEYRNTIRDLTGVDFNTTEEFPSDDTGYGFDTIADALSVSPLLLEKYMGAAQTIVASAVPAASKTIPQALLSGSDFKSAQGEVTGEKLSFYKDATVGAAFKAPVAGDYRVLVELKVRGSFDFDPGRCKVVMNVDDRQAWQQELGWQDGKKIAFELPEKWDAGQHQFAFQLHPLAAAPQALTSVDLQISSVTIQGPLDPKKWTASAQYRRFFPREEIPTGASDRRQYAREVLGAFAGKAFRRPVDDATLDRLVKVAEGTYSLPGGTFERGVSAAMVATLSSPRFLFRIERSEPGSTAQSFSPIDEYSLASRLSYFLWSTMPDDRLMDLAARGELRKDLPAEVKRMLDDPRSQALVDNFTGQWLEARDVEGISIDARSVFIRDNGQEKEFQRVIEAFRARQAARAAAKVSGATVDSTGAFKRPAVLQQPKIQLDTSLRQAMRQEAELFFASIMHEDRSVGDFLDCDYTYLNEKLASHYGVPNVIGKQMRRVTLPADTQRGGLITMGAVLVVTSNPTRTSPVKRGQFILDNILGMPSPPPPADIPPLEDAEKGLHGREPTLRETLAIHRESPLCSSCHARMDPLGLSLENFNALGLWRTSERNQPIDASGTLITGESFSGAGELKHILRTRHLVDFERCLTEKLMTYALGRGIEYYDVDAVDRIVDSLQKSDGRFSTMLVGIIESAPFQNRRNHSTPTTEPARLPDPEQRVQLQVQP